MADAVQEYLSDYTLSALFSNPILFKPYIKIQKYRAGELITGDLLLRHTLYIFLEGRFNVYGLQSDGSQFLFRSCEPVMMIGENELIVQGYKDLQEVYQNTAFSIEMLTDCTALSLYYRDIRPLLLQDVQFLNMVCRSLVEKTLHFGRLEMSASLASAESRVAQYILSTAGRDGIFKTNQTIAAEQLRMSYRHFHRVLKKFMDAGCLERISGGYKILDRDALELY